MYVCFFFFACIDLTSSDKPFKMGAKESVPQHKHKVRILVSGNDPYWTRPLIKKYVHQRSQHTGVKIQILQQPIMLVHETVSIDDVSVLLEIKDVSSVDDLHKDVYNRYLKMELTRHPHVGLMLLYNPTIKHSFERVKEMVVIDLPRLLHGSKSALPVAIVGYGHCLGKTKVSYYAAREFANERDIPVVEVYDRGGDNVELAFMTLIGEVVHFRSLE